MITTPASNKSSIKTYSVAIAWVKESKLIRTRYSNRPFAGNYGRGYGEFLGISFMEVKWRSRIVAFNIGEID